MTIPRLGRTGGGDPLMSVARTLLLVTFWIGGISCSAQDTFERAPIHYSSADADNPVARLQAKIEEGHIELDRDGHHGYLKTLLDELQIPISSQVLVFSKTSFQPSRISPRTPRALYFNDDVYVGWVQNSSTLELSVADRALGTSFYTLADENGTVHLKRETHSCLQCHASSQTAQIPGHIVRSVFPGRDGNPVYRAGTFRTDQASPFQQRWGGWYVSGTHGSQRHMGNVVVDDAEQPESLDVEAGANLSDLSTKFDTSSYLNGHSDLVALMVLVHQTEIHNLITAANFQTRQALHHQAEMNRIFKEPEGYQSDTTKSRIRNSCRRLVKAMLFCGETKLTDRVTGSSRFSEEFAARGPFDGLPPTALGEIYQQLYEVLTGNDDDPDFAHLTQDDRLAILAILRQTKKDLPDYWQ